MPETDEVEEMNTDESEGTPGVPEAEDSGDTPGETPETAEAEDQGEQAPAEVPDDDDEDDESPVYVDPVDAVAQFKKDDLIGDQFRVVRLIGRGGMGIVYEVEDKITKGRIALKVMLPSVLTSHNAVEQFIQEVNIARKLRHPGVVAAYDVREWNSLLFFTMELVKGNTLRRMLEVHGSLSLGKSAGLIHRVCLALEYAHKYTVHCDISPENIMVAPDATVQILDFGVAKAFDYAADSGPQIPLGKAHYLAPEQSRSGAPIDARTDIFSLGVVFFEMLTGELPSGYTRLTEICPDLPTECDQVVADALAPFEQRIKTAKELRKRVAACYTIYKQRTGKK